MKKTIFILAFALSHAFAGLAQTNSLSPLSIYGIGDEPLSSVSMYNGMGHTQIAMIDPVAINPLNPGTYSYLARPVFNFDLRAETLQLNSNGSAQSNTLVSVSNLTFGFPILVREKRKRNAGISFGLTPRSRAGYEVITTDEHPDLGTISYQFNGDGGLNDFYLGLGYDLINDSGSVNVLTLGLRGQYAFGTITRSRYTLFESSALASNAARESQLEISSADFQAGFLYKRKLFLSTEDKSGFITLGGYFKPSVKLGGFERTNAFTFTGSVSAISVIDTVLSTNDASSITTPTSFGLGLGYNYNNRWMFGIDLASVRWTELEFDGANANLNDANRISLGTEFVPDYTAYKKFFEVMRYRAGFSFQQTRLNISGVQPIRYGINLGLGVPLFASRSTSMFNVAFEFAQRTGSGLQITESYFNLQFGVSVTPNIYDKWFNKRKYD